MAQRSASHDLSADCGQLLLVGFEGHALPPTLSEALAHGRVGGTILFTRNVASVDQVADLNAAIYAAAGDAPLPWIAIDQEGGRVQRIRAPLLRIPPMAAIGATRDVALAASVAEVIGDELEALGFNLNFAPCADVATRPENEVIGDRAFGSDPDLVARMAGAFVAGTVASGLVPCAKHFPGHGDTIADSHFDLPVIEHAPERLQQIELEPFRRLAASGVPMMMTAHVLVPCVDATYPATMSNAWITGVLRRQLKFGGVVVSDDLEMAAVAERYEISEIVERGLHAGLDIFLICHTQKRWEEAYDTLMRLGERSTAEREMIAMAAGRVRLAKKNFLRPWHRPSDLSERLGRASHQAILDRVRPVASS